MDIMELLRSLIELNLGEYLLSVGTAPWIIDFIGVATLATVCMVLVIFLIWLERKVIVVEKF